MKSLRHRLLSSIAIAALAFVASNFVAPQAEAASVTYNSMYGDVLHGNIDFDSDIFHCELVDATYTPNKDTHTKRSDITGEVVGTGYTAGGAVCTFTISVNTATDQIDLQLNSVSWPSSTITARGMVITKWRGGAASADELIHYVDFGANITSTNGTFTGAMATPIRIQN
ncbi:MAG TPA: hypothetical protein VFS24_08690 [Steroidobacteraceae bacterium]|nr:hypothetical protein [Steroidobacteraceae bacterium]